VGYFSHKSLSLLQYPLPASPLSGGGAKQTIPLKRLGVNASRPHSEVTPREWFETKGSSRAKRDSVAKQRPEGRGQRPSSPELRGPPKRRHFAAITKAAETRPFQPCAASILQRQKARGSRGRRRLAAPLPVWAGAHGFEFKDLKAGIGQPAQKTTP
jgi:hypothetical protein